MGNETTIETLWTTLPTNEENALKEVIKSITNKNLASLSVNQLIEKLETKQAADYREVFGQYNSIPSINNMDDSKILDRAKSVRSKFDTKNRGQIIYPDLKDKIFLPNQLLSLVILSYSNSNLIGPKLRKALNDDNSEDVKREILEDSAYVRAQNRVAPWASNLRLVNYAFYANDTLINLPVIVINRVINETTIQQEHIVKIVDQRGGFEEVVNGPERARSERAIASEDSFAALQSLQLDEEEDTSEHDYSKLPFPVSTQQDFYFEDSYGPFIEGSTTSNTTSHATSTSNLNDRLIGSLAFFHIARNIPVVGAVAGNIFKDIGRGIHRVGNFFSNNNTEHAEQLEQKIPLLTPTAKS